MKRICFVDFDMSVTGGVEQVTASLVNALCKTYKVYLWAATNMDGELAYEIDPRVVYTQMEGKEERLRNLIARSFKPCAYRRGDKTFYEGEIHLLRSWCLDESVASEGYHTDSFF